MSDVLYVGEDGAPPFQNGWGNVMRKRGAPMTIEELREQGYSVKFKHLRVYKIHEELVSILATVREMKWNTAFSADFTQRELSPTGGQTICVILRGPQVIATGTSIVNPVDSYDKRLGRIKSFGRALAEFQRAPRAPVS